MQERPVLMGRKCKKARQSRFNARKACVNGSEVQEKLGKGGLMQKRPVLVG
jgi:hypothetical protein